MIDTILSKLEDWSWLLLFIICFASVFNFRSKSIAIFTIITINIIDYVATSFVHWVYTIKLAAKVSHVLHVNLVTHAIKVHLSFESIKPFHFKSDLVNSHIGLIKQCKNKTTLFTVDRFGVLNRSRIKYSIISKVKRRFSNLLVLHSSRLQTEWLNNTFDRTEHVVFAATLILFIFAEVSKLKLINIISISLQGFDLIIGSASSIASIRLCKSRANFTLFIIRAWLHRISWTLFANGLVFIRLGTRATSRTERASLLTDSSSWTLHTVNAAAFFHTLNHYAFYERLSFWLKVILMILFLISFWYNS